MGFRAVPSPDDVAQLLVGSVTQTATRKLQSWPRGPTPALCEKQKVPHPAPTSSCRREGVTFLFGLRQIAATLLEVDLSVFRWSRCELQSQVLFSTGAAGRSERQCWRLRPSHLADSAASQSSREPHDDPPNGSSCIRVARVPQRLFSAVVEAYCVALRDAFWSHRCGFSSHILLGPPLFPRRPPLPNPCLLPTH